MDEDKALKRFADRVGYTPEDLECFSPDDPRIRLMDRLSRAAARYSLEATVVEARHCNSGYQVGDRFVMDVAGNLVGKFCPPQLCVYAISQLVVPVALINERLSEGLDPNLFHFMQEVRCLDVGVECGGYGGIRLRVRVIPRVK